MTLIHVIEPFASGVTTAIISIAWELKGVKQIVVHGSRSWVDTEENVRKKFPPNTEFIRWKHAEREISLKNDILALVSLISILKKVKTKDSVIHLHSSKAGFLGRLACRILGIKAVLYTPHGASFIRKDVSPFKRALFKMLEKTGGYFCGTVVGCGQSEGELYTALGKKALWVANGVKVEGAGSTKKEQQVCFAGIANTQKNPALFNDIAAAFANTNTPKFIWAGDGVLREKLASPNIHITGWLPSEKLQPILNTSLVYLSTSGWEGLPYGALEAMKSSCALLLTDVPGNRDLVVEGVNGFLFRTAEEASAILKKLLADTEKTKKMGVESFRLVKEQFSIKQMGEKYYKIYQEQLSG
jgi:glycosyltransferase involved in cell wall biosynthesis